MSYKPKNGLNTFIKVFSAVLEEYNIRVFLYFMKGKCFLKYSLVPQIPPPPSHYTNQKDKNYCILWDNS